MGREKGVPSWAEAPKRRGQVHLRIDKLGDVGLMSLDGAAGYLIGRNESSCDIVCEHKTCSRVHACVAHRPDGKFYVVDLGSVQGTVVDGDEIEPESKAELVPGETVFTLGQCPWRFSLEHGPALGAGSSAGQAEDRMPSRADGREHPVREGRHQQREDMEADPQRATFSRRPRDTDSRHRDSSHSRHREFSRSKRRRHDSPRSERHERDDWHARRGHRHSPVPNRGAENQLERQSKFTPADPASVVRGMAAAPAAAMPFSSTEQKKKLLWGNKAAGSSQGPSAEGGGGFGANRWDQAQFENEADQEKFRKLMGASKDGPPPAAAAGHQQFEREGPLAANEQSRVLGDVESHFMQGLRRADGRKVGLGL